MAFRVVFVENNWNMKIKLDNLICSNDDGEIQIPLSDISTIVLDNLTITLTTRLLCRLAECNIALIICDQQHLPIGFFSSYDNHSRMAKKIKYQIEKNTEFYDELWAQIICAKILNQAKTLEIAGKEENKVDAIRAFSEEISSGDKTNREAHAAKVYFNELFGTSFSRGNADLVVNSALDYGYSILRSYIARLCVGYGLNSQIGIHHKNEYNRFNLVDDLIEPVRPIVDRFAVELVKNEKYLTGGHRRALANILNHMFVYNNKKMYLCNMLEEYVSNYANLLEGKADRVVFPLAENYLGDASEHDEV